MFNILSWFNLLIIFLICKNMISYNEELLLWLIYTSLFVILITLLYTVVINYLLQISFNLMVYYELLLLLKSSLLNKISLLFKLFVNNKILPVLTFQLNSLIRAIGWNVKQKKSAKDFFFVVKILAYKTDNV